MTRAEFTTFLKIHTGNFTGFDGWFAGKQGDDPVSLKARAETWLAGLRFASLDEAQFASMELAHSAEKPEGFSNHLGWLREAIVRLRRNHPQEPRQLQGRRYECERCQDTGMATVLPIEGYRFRSAEGYPIKPWAPVSVLCDCHRGNKPWPSPDAPGMKRAVWDDQTMVLARPDVETLRRRSEEIVQAMREQGRDADADRMEAFLAGGPVPRELTIAGGR